ncbi:hypothetical protein D3C81_1079580 [compost metagenome]
MIDKAAFAPSAEFTQVAAHQTVDEAGEHGQQKQGGRQDQNGQTHHESESDIHRRQYKILDAHIQLIEPAPEAVVLARRPRLLGEIRKTGLDQ